MNKKFWHLFTALALLGFGFTTAMETSIQISNPVYAKATTKKSLLKLHYSGQQTVDVNHGNPTFSDDDLSTSNGRWDSYGDLDTMNRPTAANALINQSSMPTEKREPLTFTPTGWHNKKLKSGYLYNRSHLIGFQLTGQNNNPKNLITGTRQLNNPEMLHYEDDIADYIKNNPNDYVRYQVTPIFKENELVARGVHMQAQSIGSNTIHFNVFIFNIEDGVNINYSDGTSTVSSSEAESSSTVTAPATTLPVTQSNNDNQQVVYYTPNGTKYHFNRNCRALRRSSDVESTTVSDAQARGLTLCGFED
jgi:DNA-entry nuclease